MSLCRQRSYSIIFNFSSFVASQVGPEDHAICALSGGVDSTVAATLVHKVLGDRLHCVFVDNGLLRLKVSKQGGTRRGRRGLPAEQYVRPRTCVLGAGLRVNVERVGGLTREVPGSGEGRRDVVGPTRMPPCCA
jgi:hypothetical protein